MNTHILKEQHCSSWMDFHFSFFDIWQGAGNQYKGFSDCVKTILREEGSSALWKVKFISALLTHSVGVNMMETFGYMFLISVQSC